MNRQQYKNWNSNMNGTTHLKTTSLLHSEVLRFGALLVLQLICTLPKTIFQNEKAWLAFFLLSSFWFSFNSWLMHYFKVSDKYFVVKNHNFFWKTKAYLLSDIDEVVFETQGKMPNCLRVITKNFKSKMYPAGTLRNKTWLQLKDKLEQYHIKVRNECIF